MSQSIRETNHETFKDCFSAALLQRLTKDDSKVKKKRRKAKVEDVPEKENGDDGELAEFIEFLADEIFPSLPDSLQDLSFSAAQNDTDLSQWENLTLSSTEDSIIPLLPPSINDSLSSYSLLPPASFPILLHDALSSYITQCISAPPPAGLSRGSVSECEICDRDWLPLTYHHLIPRSMHEKALKRGWHTEWELANVAWLCRACHSYVHKVVGNEDLARTFYTVEKLLEREDVRRWSVWVGTVRWKAR